MPDDGGVLAEAERRVRAMTQDMGDVLSPSEVDSLLDLLVEYDRRGAELERVHSSLRHESDAHVAERDRLRAIERRARVLAEVNTSSPIKTTDAIEAARYILAEST